MIKVLVIVFILCVAGFVIRLAMLGRQSQSAVVALGLTENHLLSCANSGNKGHCVSSLDQEKSMSVEPLRYTGDSMAAGKRLQKVLGDLGLKVIPGGLYYFRAEAKSSLFGFVDDIEFHVMSGGVIEVKSCSRVGRSDFGVNRKRVERIRRAFLGS